MKMTDDEKAAAAERRAEERLAEALVREQNTQQSLRGVSFSDEDQRKISYLNRQLLLPSRSADWAFLRNIREDILRFYTDTADRG